MDEHPNRADPEFILSTPLPESSSSAAAASATRSLTTNTASPFEPLRSASLHSKKNTVLLCDWWLRLAPEVHEGRRLSVGGVVAERYKGSCRHEGDRSGSKFLRSPWQKAERVFESAPITKRYDSFTLGTADGITVRIQGVINKACSHQNGIPLEVCNSFLIGFPYNWDNYAGPCFEGKFNSASVPESAASANELSEGCLFPVHLDDFSLSRIHDGSVDGSVTRKFRDFLERFCYTTKPVASDVHNCTLPLVESCLPHEPPSKYERAIVHTQVTDGLEHVARFEKFSGLSSRDHQNILVEGLDPTPNWKKIAEKEKYEKERIRQKHGNGSSEGYVVGPPEAAGCYRDGLQGDEVDGGNLITAHIENNVSLGSSLYATSQVNTLPIKVADVQKISLESIQVDNCISLATSIRVSMGTVDLIPNCTGEANSESSSSLADGVITENFSVLTSDVQQIVSLDSSLHLTSQVDRQVPSSENKPEPDNCIHLASSVAVSLDTVNDMPNCTGEANKDINTSLVDSGIESIVADILPEEFNLPNSKHAKELRNVRRSDDSERIGEHDVAFSKGFLAREVSDTEDGYSSRKDMNPLLHISLKPVMAPQLTAESSENNEKYIFQVVKDSTAHMSDMPGKGICGATDDMFSIENNTMPIKRQSTTQSVVRKLYYATRSGRLVGSSTNESQSLDERVNERMENVEDIPATDATLMSRTTKSKNQGGVDQTISSLKAEANGDRVVRVDHSFVKTVNDGKYKRRNLSACDLATARAVYFTHESSATKLQIDPAPTSDTEGGGLTDEQISVNIGHESEFLTSTNANTTQSDSIMRIHSSKEKILDLSINKIQNNQSKRDRKKKQSPLSVYRACKKGRSLHSSGRVIWRPSYDNQYPLTRDTAKKLCIASPESLNLKRSRSGRLLVPPIAQWCQKIIYAANGEITAITGEGLENFPCIESESEAPRKIKRLV